MFLDLKILKVREIIKSQQLKLVYDFCNNILPSDLQDLFIFSGDVHTTGLELNSFRKRLLHIPRIKTVTYGNKSLKFLCADLWNSTFKNGIAIDKNVKNNMSCDKIRNLSYLKKLDYLMWKYYNF